MNLDGEPCLHKKGKSFATTIPKKLLDDEFSDHVKTGGTCTCCQEYMIERDCVSRCFGLRIDAGLTNLEVVLREKTAVVLSLPVSRSRQDKNTMYGGMNAKGFVVCVVYAVMR